MDGNRILQGYSLATNRAEIMETKLYQTAKEFFKFLNNYEADIWIRGSKAYDVNGELVAEYNTQF